MNKRLQQFLSAENISQSQFAETIGVAKASISHILAGRNKPGYDFMENITRCYPKLNLEWLILGRGRMYKDTVQDRMTDPQEAIQPQETPTTPVDNQESPSISKVVIFYDNGTFKEFR